MKKFLNKFCALSYTEGCYRIHTSSHKCMRVCVCNFNTVDRAYPQETTHITHLNMQHAHPTNQQTHFICAYVCVYNVFECACLRQQTPLTTHTPCCRTHALSTHCSWLLIMKWPHFGKCAKQCGSEHNCRRLSVRACMCVFRCMCFCVGGYVTFNVRA